MGWKRKLKPSIWTPRKNSLFTVLVLLGIYVVSDAHNTRVHANFWNCLCSQYQSLCAQLMRVQSFKFRLQHKYYSYRKRHRYQVTLIPEVTDGDSFHDFIALLINVTARINNPVANPVCKTKMSFIICSVALNLISNQHLNQ